MPDPQLPTEEQLLGLPHWARVAFAARCARRVWTHFTRHWSDAPREYAADFDRVIEYAERIAVRAADYDVPDYSAHAAEIDADSARAAVRRVADAARSAHEECAGAVASAAHDGRAADAVAAAVRAGVAVADITRDFERIRACATNESWTDATAVPQSVFEPLGEPEPAARESFELIIEVFARGTDNSAEVASGLVSLYETLNEFSLLRYGRGLTVAEFEQYVRARARVPVR